MPTVQTVLLLIETQTFQPQSEMTAFDLEAVFASMIIDSEADEEGKKISRISHSNG